MKLKLKKKLIFLLTTTGIILTTSPVNEKSKTPISSKNTSKYILNEEEDIVINNNEDTTKYILNKNQSITNNNQDTITSSYKNKQIVKQENNIKNEDNKNTDYQIVPVVIATDNVNIREQASTTSNILGVLSLGESVPKISDEINGWYEISYGDSTGYVSYQYVRPDYQYEINSPLINVGYLPNGGNLYNDKSLANLKTLIEPLQSIEIYGETDNSYFVKIDNNIGYIPKEYCIILSQPVAIVDKSTQNLKLYNNNEIVIDTPIVSGNESADKYTPSDEGLFDIDEKRYNTHLTGQTWDVAVDIFMPYNGGEGLHDASWRSVFGGSNYLNGNGSHGCINMPHDMAIEAGKYLNTGDKVLVKK